MSDLALALLMSAAISMVAFGSLVGILIFWIADQRGRRRAGRRRRRVVRSQRTRATSRGHRPYRGGMVRV